MIGMETID